MPEYPSDHDGVEGTRDQAIRAGHPPAPPALVILDVLDVPQHPHPAR